MLGLLDLGWYEASRSMGIPDSAISQDSPTGLFHLREEMRQVIAKYRSIWSQ